MWIFFRHISLRTQLVALMAVLMMLGVAGIAWATAQSSKQALVGRIDDGLRSAYANVDSSLQSKLDKDADAAQIPAEAPPAMYAALFDDDGKLLTDLTTYQTDDSPALKQVRPSDVEKHERVPYTVRGTEPGSRGWRVLMVDSSSEVRTVVVAAPLQDTVDTVERATSSILVTGTLATMLMSMVGYAVVTRTFRPLRRVERTAAAIAQGELSRRVEEYPIETEVGRLSYSLNAMLSQIETAFRAMGASEEKMRRFIQDASHELRTPLVTIRGYSELYRHGGIPQGEPLDQAMGRIESEAKRMSQLVEDLLTLARLDEERPLQSEPLDLLVLAGDAVADANVNAPDRKVRLVGLDGAPLTSASTVGDEAKLRQVVVNLMTNALRYTPDGTPIEIAVGTRPVMEGRSDAVLAVVDHGNGIPEEDAQRIFERFYRSDASRQRGTGGTGLGLAIVAAIAKQHDGGIRLSETPGGGATMSLHVPYVPMDPVDHQVVVERPAGPADEPEEPSTNTGVLQRLRGLTRKAGDATRRVGEVGKKAAESRKHEKREDKREDKREEKREGKREDKRDGKREEKRRHGKGQGAVKDSPSAGEPGAEPQPGPEFDA
ncbi:MAG: ATP-binding protein [Galactobacter sp.]